MPPLLIRDGRQPTRGEPLQRYRRDHPPNACPQHDCCRVDNGRVEVCADGRAGFIQQRRRHEHRAVPNALLSLSLHICGPRALRPTPRRACVRAVCSRLLYPRTSPHHPVCHRRYLRYQGAGYLEYRSPAPAHFLRQWIGWTPGQRACRHAHEGHRRCGPREHARMPCVLPVEIPATSSVKRWR